MPKRMQILLCLYGVFNCNQYNYTKVTLMHSSDKMEGMTPNALINEKSPYLLQHAHNPVNWYPWREEAFTRAKEEHKPIFLGIGYSTRATGVM
jgi:hypothetical protein